MSRGPLLVVGRGPSACGFDWPDGVPTLAVSSGVFVFPPGRKPVHFCTLDEPKYFQDQLTEHESVWAKSEHIHYWPFWSDPDIVKHVKAAKYRTCRYRPFDFETALDACPNEEAMRNLIREYGKVQHQFGLQPGWADFPSVFGWDTDDDGPMTFVDGETPGMDGFLNSLAFGIQIGHQIGYDPLIFVGVDLDGAHYLNLRKRFLGWKYFAETQGKTWLCGTDKSPMSAFMECANAECRIA